MVVLHIVTPGSKETVKCGSYQEIVSNSVVLFQHINYICANSIFLKVT
ncbi:MAG TPA: hypothetical protein PK957_04265 [Candidatus Dojkabacteria bacterium]|nr:hypothetical protein [Candidatus Dojkabacteria bacterium]